jgi:folate-dependent tRNA-U54 methylase TrmFO/GidA
MKEGFYLSPDGLYIVELRKQDKITSFFDVIGYEPSNKWDKSDFITDLCCTDLSMFFSTWGILE